MYIDDYCCDITQHYTGAVSQCADDCDVIKLYSILQGSFNLLYLIRHILSYLTRERDWHAIKLCVHTYDWTYAAFSVGWTVACSIFVWGSLGTSTCESVLLVSIKAYLSLMYVLFVMVCCSFSFAACLKS